MDDIEYEDVASALAEVDRITRALADVISPYMSYLDAA